jgi:hypothetical protein
MKIIKRDYKPNSTAPKFGNYHGEIVATLSTLCATWSWGKESQEPFYMLRGGAYLLYFDDFAEALDLAITLYLVAEHNQDADPKIKERLEDLRRFVDFDLNPPSSEEEESKVPSEKFAKLSSFGNDQYEHALGWTLAQSVLEPTDEKDKS